MGRGAATVQVCTCLVVAVQLQISSFSKEGGRKEGKVGDPAAGVASGDQLQEPPPP